MARKSISKRTRFEVFKRDDFQCRYCGARAPEMILHVDHVVPVCDGGSDEEDNLVTACEGCNLGKGPIGLANKHAPISKDAASDLTEKTDQMAAYREAMADWIVERDEYRHAVAVSVYDAIWGHETPDRMLGKKDTSSACRFMEKLGFRAVLMLAEEVGSKTHKFYDFHRAWKYFYACCRNQIASAEGDQE